jgi:uncharacterized RDD family membrane protein YckC
MERWESTRSGPYHATPPHQMQHAAQLVILLILLLLLFIFLILIFILLLLLPPRWTPGKLAAHRSSIGEVRERLYASLRPVNRS